MATRAPARISSRHRGGKGMSAMRLDMDRPPRAVARGSALRRHESPGRRRPRAPEAALQVLAVREAGGVAPAGRGGIAAAGIETAGVSWYGGRGAVVGRELRGHFRRCQLAAYGRSQPRDTGPHRDTGQVRSPLTATDRGPPHFENDATRSPGGYVHDRRRYA